MTDLPSGRVMLSSSPPLPPPFFLFWGDKIKFVSLSWSVFSVYLFLYNVLGQPFSDDILVVFNLT